MQTNGLYDYYYAFIGFLNILLGLRLAFEFLL